jgi:hypothetical protein
MERHKVQPGSVSFIQRFGSSLNLNVHFPFLFLESVYLDRTEASRKPQFISVEPPREADVADVVQKLSRRVIRTLRHPGYLEAGRDLEKLAALAPLPHVHLVRYGGCLAPHSHLRGVILPTLRQQGLDEPEVGPPSLRWSWVRLLQRVFALDLTRCPFCPRGTLRLIAVMTQAEVIREILRHLKRAADPPPIAPARTRQAPYDWVA